MNVSKRKMQTNGDEDGSELEVPVSSFEGATRESGGPQGSRREHVFFDRGSTFDIVDDGELPSKIKPPLNKLEMDEDSGNKSSSNYKYKNLVHSQDLRMFFDKIERRDLIYLNESDCDNLGVYISRFEAASFQCLLPEKQKVFFFIRGLMKCKRDKLSENVPESLRDAINRVKALSHLKEREFKFKCQNLCLLMLEGLVNNYPVARIVVNTALSRSVINLDIVEGLRLNHFPTEGVIRLTNGSAEDVVGETYPLKLCVGKGKYLHPFNILRNMDYDMVLGMDFLWENNIIEWYDNGIEFKNFQELYQFQQTLD